MPIPVPASTGSRALFFQNLKTFFTFPQSRAISLVFASFSTLFGGWVTHIPYVKDQLGLDEAELGLTLFALPAGLVTMNPLSPLIINRLGPQLTTMISVLLYCLVITIPILAPSVPLLALGLFLSGFTSALLNVAMNTCATAVERHHGLTIMSSCHAMWSLGGLLGAGVSSLLMGLGVSPQAHMLGMSALIFGFNIYQRGLIFGIPFVKPEEKGALFTWPNGALLGMILIGAAIGLGEGTAFDWSAVYLRDTLGTSPGVAALAFAGFSATMTLGRFTGDTLIPRYGEHRLLFYCSLAGAAGLVLAILVPHPLVAILGFTILGAGCSVGAPILYSASSRVPGLAPGVGLATFATFSFIGFLAGPPTIGILAREVGLAEGLGVVAALLLGAAVLARRVRW